ncbi:MAG: hypothetical protein M1829_003575 [Trizodia sp. TS-e1964]|nr:MAG: hypothetical protein M1829_003575 [Trizodia sp. TS-e1964]
MPIQIAVSALFYGLGAIPYSYTIIKGLLSLTLIFLVKRYFGGASNSAERVLHSKVILITGGTSGIGAHVAFSLAKRGAQIILLTHHPPSDPFIAEYVLDLRTKTGNELVYAEHVDLSSLHSIRLFATRWIDNVPSRRVDMVILCAAALSPPFTTTPQLSQDGVEITWAVNYLANFHLLGILSPALKAQPADREVRVIFTTCSSYMAGPRDAADLRPSELGSFSSGKAYGASKLALMVFAQSFQKHLDAYERPGKEPNNTRVILVDPGWTRTPGMRRWLSAGALWGLLVYLAMWPFWWLTLKDPEKGAQSILTAAMEAELGRGRGGRLIKECRERPYMRKEIGDEGAGKQLWEASDKLIEQLEKEAAKRRALGRAEAKRNGHADDAGNLKGTPVEKDVSKSSVASKTKSC